ncbi:hypothetical protein [Escherichia phage vB_EcoP_PAS59]|uniref:Cell wall hydrolase SleB domain-containing protein n=1 Tax=Escherichia phage vB_EcoP_PAS59 TaxID=3053873 RepID=A0AA51VHG1_9CAUD|nr:hypothetical protein [Escherichia phage vB_EcoP_PAS59]
MTLTIYYEAGNQPTACKALVADTVINRMSQRKLTAEQVINQRNQFEWIPVLLKKEKPFKRYVKLIRDDNPLTKKSIRESEWLARRALKKGYVPLYSGTYFQSKSEGVPKWYTNPMYCGDLVFNNSARD